MMELSSHYTAAAAAAKNNRIYSKTIEIFPLLVFKITIL
jgi:hypothetical protein